MIDEVIKFIVGKAWPTGPTGKKYFCNHGDDFSTPQGLGAHNGKTGHKKAFFVDYENKKAFIHFSPDGEEVKKWVDWDDLPSEYQDMAIDKEPTLESDEKPTVYDPLVEEEMEFFDSPNDLGYHIAESLTSMGINVDVQTLQEDVLTLDLDYPVSEPDADSLVEQYKDKYEEADDGEPEPEKSYSEQYYEQYEGYWDVPSHQFNDFVALAQTIGQQKVTTDLFETAKALGIHPSEFHYAEHQKAIAEAMEGKGIPSQTAPKKSPDIPFIDTVTTADGKTLSIDKTPGAQSLSYKNKQGQIMSMDIPDDALAQAAKYTLTDLKSGLTKSGISFGTSNEGQLLISDGKAGFAVAEAEFNALVNNSGHTWEKKPKLAVSATQAAGNINPQFVDVDDTVYPEPYQPLETRPLPKYPASAYAKNIPYTHKKAVQGYTGSTFGPINSNLRKGKVTGSMDAKLINEAIQSAPQFSEPITLYRNVRTPTTPEDIKLYRTLVKAFNQGVGTRVNIPGFQSTSVKPGVFDSDSYTGGLRFEIQTTHGLPVRDISSFEHEDEVILGHDWEYEVVGMQSGLKISTQNYTGTLVQLRLVSTKPRKDYTIKGMVLSMLEEITKLVMKTDKPSKEDKFTAEWEGMGIKVLNEETGEYEYIDLDESK